LDVTQFSPPPLFPLPDGGERPRIDERHTGLPYRHGWFAGNAIGANEELRAQGKVVHIDHAAPRAGVYEFAQPGRVSEPGFVPRSADASKGDGWPLATAWRGATNISDLAIASLPHRVPNGIHGNWVPAEDLEKGCLL
jgi:carotenoid cleavage dioxygenase-like enzyme